VVIDHKGKQKKRYPYAQMMTPYEKLKSLPNVEQHLKQGMTLQHSMQSLRLSGIIRRPNV